VDLIDHPHLLERQLLPDLIKMAAAILMSVMPMLLGVSVMAIISTWRKSSCCLPLKP